MVRQITKRAIAPPKEEAYDLQINRIRTFITAY
jgi:hypothetical protein